MTTENTITEILVTEAIATEGKALAILDKSRESKARRDFRKDISADGGFLWRLGSLMVELRQDLNEGERVSSKLIKAAGVASIPAARRSEAHRLVTTWDAIEAFLKAKGSKATSLTWIFAEMDKQAKLDTADNSEDPSEGDDDGEGDAEHDDPLTLDMMVISFIAHLKDCGFTVEQAMDAMIENQMQATASLEAAA
jgi:hypothetical protein|tara:strand:+ start:280 stop:867 length:588 start_codon:yes stop_codon:yes gene_type:complete